MKMKRLSSNHGAAMKVLTSEEGGVALILVLSVMVTLVAIVGQFSYSMRTEINITRNFKEEEEAYRLAIAGIESAKMEILSAENPAEMYVNENGILIFGGGEDEEGDEGVAEPERKESLGRGTFEYTITDEDGKLSLNHATIEQLKDLFLDSGVDVTDVDTIVDSIMDWRDTNDLHMLNGAEEDYYRSLEKPYSCKDGPFDSVEELLLVRDMTPEILFGTSRTFTDEIDEEDEEAYEGVVKYLTVKGSGKININTAERTVLELVLGEEKADDILTQRESGPITRPMKGGKVSSSFFTVVSTGFSADRSVKRTVKLILHKKDKNNMETVHWNDNFIG
jgi:general secretion pathway protein K